MAKKNLQLVGEIDEDLKLVRDEDGTDTSVSLSKDKLKINGDFEATGSYKGPVTIDSGVIQSDNDITLNSAGDITLDSKGDVALVSGSDMQLKAYLGDITLDAGGGEIYLKDGGPIFGEFSTSGSETSLHLYEDGGASVNDYLAITVAANGATNIITTDAAGTSADMVIKADGDLTFNSTTGVFKAFKGLQEFSATDSAYAGMILGCSHIFGSGTGGQFVQISTAWENLVWDTDKFALVTFKVPPSNRVKISVHLPWIAAASYAVQLGLATDSSATPLNTKYQNDVNDANRADSFNINYSWVVEGSDHSWASGETKTLYIMAYTSNNVRFYTGGTNASGYGGVIVEATALPATIGDGSEP